MLDDPTKSDLLEETERFLQQATDLRSKLLQERSSLRARLEQIDQLLSKLPGGKKAKVRGEERESDEEEDLPDLSEETNASDLVTLVLTHIGKPASAQEVIDTAEMFSCEIPAANIHSALSRLARDGRIGRKGERGSYKFFVRGSG